MFEKCETHDIPFFSLRDMRFSLLHFKLPFWKCFRLAAPGKAGGVGGASFFLFVWFSRPYTRAFTIPFGHRGWTVHRFGLPDATCSIWPIVEKKKMYFLYLLDVHTTKLGYVLFPPHPLPSKEVLSYLFKDPQNKYFSWFPPSHHCQIIIIILIINHRVLRWEKKKNGSVAILGEK